MCTVAFGFSFGPLSWAGEPADHYRTLGVPADSCKDEIERAFQRKVAALGRNTKLSEAEKRGRRRQYIEAWEHLTLADKRSAYDRGRARLKAQADIEELVEETLTSPRDEVLADLESQAVDRLAEVGNQILALDLIDSWLVEDDGIPKAKLLGTWLARAEPSHPRFLQIVTNILGNSIEGQKDFLKQFIEPHFEEPAVFDTLLGWLLEDSSRGEFAAGLIAEFTIQEGANAEKLIALHSLDLSPMMRSRLAVMASDAVQWDSITRPMQGMLSGRVWKIARQELAFGDEAADLWLQILGRLEIPKKLMDGLVDWFKGSREVSEDPKQQELEEAHRYVATRAFTAMFHRLPESVFVEIAISLQQDQTRELAVELLSRLAPANLSDRLRSVVPRVQSTLDYIHEFSGPAVKEAVDRVWKVIGPPDVIAHAG